MQDNYNGPGRDEADASEMIDYHAPTPRQIDNIRRLTIKLGGEPREVSYYYSIFTEATAASAIRSMLFEIERRIRSSVKGKVFTEYPGTDEEAVNTRMAQHGVLTPSQSDALDKKESGGGKESTQTSKS